MLLNMWRIWQKNTKSDVCVMYMKSFSAWQKENSPSLRDSNRRMKSIAVFLKDFGVEYKESKYLDKAGEIFALLLKREMKEFGEDHPAVQSTRRMAAICGSKNGQGVLGREYRKGSVGMRRGSNIITPVKRPSEETVSPGLSKRIDDSPIILSPIKGDEGDDEDLDVEVKKITMDESYNGGDTMGVSFNVGMLEEKLTNKAEESYFYSKKEEAL